MLRVGPDGRWTVFLDRDGTINRKAPEGDYVRSPEAVVLLDGAAAAIARLRARLPERYRGRRPLRDGDGSARGPPTAAKEGCGASGPRGSSLGGRRGLAARARAAGAHSRASGGLASPPRLPRGPHDRYGS